jgi:hypothetical protein
MDIQAVYNGGHWKAMCPEHGSLSAVLAEPSTLSIAWTENNKYLCPVCWPGFYKRAVVIKNGNVEKIFDRSARKTAYNMAMKSGQVYTVVFPDNKKEIEDILSVRDEYDLVSNQWKGRNWEPGETVAFLKKENKKLGLK